MRKSPESRIVTAEDLALRDLPKGWQGNTLESLVHSAEKVIEQSEAIGGSEDPRLSVAKRVLELRDKLREKQDKASELK